MRILTLAFLLAITSCGKNPNFYELKVKNSYMIFTDSIREDLPESKYQSILQFKNIGATNPKCTAFWIKQKEDKLLAASAKHCTAQDQNQIELGCTQKRFNFEDMQGNQFTCKRIIINDPKHDTFLMELIITKQVNVQKRAPLILSKVQPRYGIELEMYGFPADTIRKSKPTLTYNCETLGEAETVIQRDYPTAVPHNCSTFGGNSGGPIVMKDTKNVIGVPGIYRPFQDPKKPYDSYGDVHADYEDMGVFIERNQKTLETEEIEFQIFK